RSVLARVLFVADADQRLFEQLHDGCEDLLARQTAPHEIGVGTGTNPGQRLRERDQAPVLHLVAHFTPSRMIAILLAAARVAAGGLKVAERIGANPYLDPSGRNGERTDSLELRAVGHRPPVRVDVTKSVLAPEPPD